jgi:uncharacterized membrane protein YfcA
VVVPTALAGAFVHARDGEADVRAGLLVGVAAAPLAVLGAVGAELAGGRAVLLLTAGLLVAISIGMWRPGQRKTSADIRSLRPVQLLLTGVAAGAAAGFLGLGGGFVIVPMLSRWLGMPLRRAAGTSLVAISVLAVPGAAAHALLGHVEWALALVLSVGVVPGAVLGSRFSAQIRSRALEVSFAILLLVAAALLALDVGV